MSKNPIGLDAAKCAQLADNLNLLLANLQVFYINARSYHWNIKGEKFFELHLKFEELYNDLFLKIDEVAERVLTLGSTPSHTYTQYLKDSTIQESGKITQGREAVEGVLAGYRNLLVIERQLLELSAEAGDEGTNALMSDYIRQQEKMVWMYSAFLG
jgi:starvation-inducible DNA-binding protein